MPLIGEIISGTKLGISREHRLIWAACSICNKPRWVVLAKKKPVDDICKSCSSKLKMQNKNLTRENCFAWKGGERVDDDGYVRVYMPGHPQAKKEGYVLRSHLVIEQYTGKLPGKNKVVHHINRNKQDDRFENLKVLTVSEHTRIHAIDTAFGQKAVS